MTTTHFFQTTPAPAAPLEELQAQLVQLTSQLGELRAQLVILDRQIRQTSDAVVQAQLLPERAQLNTQIRAVNDQIRVVRSQIASRTSQGGGGVVLVPPVNPVPPSPPPGPQWDPDMIVALGGAVIVFVLFPLTIAFARRLWRGKPAAPISPAVNEMPARLDRLEQAVDTIAIEIERISENQRFLTKLMAEKQATPALGAGPIDPIRTTDRAPEKERIK